MKTAARMTTQTTNVVANAIVRGVRANYKPENQRAELERIAELFCDMAMSCEMEADLALDPASEFGARRDSRILDGISAAIEEVLTDGGDRA